MKVGNTHIKQITSTPSNSHTNTATSTTNSNGPSYSSVSSSNPPSNHINTIASSTVSASPLVAGTTATVHTTASSALPTVPPASAAAAAATSAFSTAATTPTTAAPTTAAPTKAAAAKAASAAAQANAAAARAAAAAKEKEKKTTTAAVAASAFYPQSTALSMASSMYGDDDINDVAAMGGVNLAEESQRILGSTELIGTQIRSCKDEVFLHMPALQAKIRQAMARHGLEEPGNDVAVLISHAAQERLKNIVEKLAVIAEHRIDIIKVSVVGGGDLAAEMLTKCSML